MWPHFVSLLHRSWDALVHAMGTTTLAIVVGVIGFVFILLLNLVFKLRKDGWSWSVTVSHFSQNLKDSIVPTVIGTLTLWGALFGLFLVRTVYFDHENLISKIRELENAPKSACPVCPSGPAGKKEALKITTKWAYLGVPDSTKTHSLAVIVATTNKRITLPDLHVVCDKEFQFMGVIVSGATMVDVYGHDNAPISKEANFELRSPAWSPDSPIVMTAATADNLMRNCKTIVR